MQLRGGILFAELKNGKTTENRLLIWARLLWHSKTAHQDLIAVELAPTGLDKVLRFETTWYETDTRVYILHGDYFITLADRAKRSQAIEIGMTTY